MLTITSLSSRRLAGVKRPVGIGLPTSASPQHKQQQGNTKRMLVKPERKWLLFGSHENRFYKIQQNHKEHISPMYDIHDVLSPSPFSKLSNRCGEDLTATTKI